MDRREFAAVLPTLIAALSGKANAADTSLPIVQSGIFSPGPPKPGAVPKRASRAYTKGMLKAGNIQLEIHETTQEVGAPHEPVETHLHSEIWLVQSGTVALTTNGVTRKMVAGDVGICVAGDKHYVQNAGDTPATYFVVTVGPPE
ncbi:cupin domain-containing protein [Edaphobacter flagellatus]|uniref:cupin domain-containing protein n=1 Tax=Edaphobacter flagellatus TaxID=1933044 RepID=UPI0021B1DE8E|nr:cupin domain-containing protein [Edaphobacter flagellatus]